MTRLRIVALAATALATSAHAAVPLASCDSPSFQQVLDASSATLDARAVWLDGRTVQWPGAEAGGTFRLYYSATAGIVAQAGAKVTGADGALPLDAFTGRLPERFKYVAAGPAFALRSADLPRMNDLHRGQLVLVQEALDGTVLAATRIQVAGALDDLYAPAGELPDLGATPRKGRTAFRLWAPTARHVAVCTYDSATGRASAVHDMAFDARTGAWSAQVARDLSGSYYKYAVDVAVDGMGLVRNLVTDPYSVSLTTDSKRSYIADLDSARLKPKGWDATRAPNTVKAQTDMVIYELHVRDFSINDPSVPASKRGKYAAFGETGSNGMRHLKALAKVGLTDIHLLPVYDLGSVPEQDCAVPAPSGTPDGESQQALTRKTAETDCFNWGYDPYHYNAPEGSYASDPSDGARRVIELRQMVMDLHKAGLRVGVDVVYNHTFIAGQNEKSVLDRVVPGYYHRLNAVGGIERSTCCDNTATENRMMAKLMIDSAELWTRHYKLDSFRFDLMGHQPRDAMERLQKRVDKAAGRHVQLIGEGWNFGEVADGARFVQASQLSLNGSGIGSFSDRARDAVRGGSAGDSGEAMVRRQGYINGLVYDPNALGGGHKATDLLQAADMIRVGLAGSVRRYRLQTFDGNTRKLEDIAYGNQPAGYASQPGEVVNYVENHDNQTLFDINVLKLPLATSTADRARVQVLGMAINAFSQGVAYYHAGIDTLRSKSLDKNSFNSGDWFNRIDWRYQDNYFGTGLPQSDDNGKDWPLLKPYLAQAEAIKPRPADIAFARDAFRDLLAIRASSTLLRMRTTDDIVQRLRFFNTGPQQEATVLAAWLDGRNYAGAQYAGIGYLVNVDKVEKRITDAALRGKALRLHPVHTAPGAADKRAAQALFDSATGSFTVPARTAVVFVEQ
ncbi:alpha-1,6-glucosidase domain-containing protein [Massilia yuzhufengensis]|uniref:Alpha-1,6-glucosidases, pullulanase-type n=1 Tax=Massilia yuzhufengensis TaxID=1164594 RepID=A0A1I1I7F6_9BURK|nr:alpha-1,6-glucosidase domain-containing protein [Massilia yuzhufengensis]SFC32359.1 alpha-1,6-glucosidases, pullulanase-type [Massilia yuzhufengensis]